MKFANHLAIFAFFSSILIAGDNDIENGNQALEESTSHDSVKQFLKTNYHMIDVDAIKSNQQGPKSRAGVDEQSDAICVSCKGQDTSSMSSQLYKQYLNARVNGWKKMSTAMEIGERTCQSIFAFTTAAGFYANPQTDEDRATVRYVGYAVFPTTLVGSVVFWRLKVWANNKVELERQKLDSFLVSSLPIKQLQDVDGESHSEKSD